MRNFEEEEEEEESMHSNLSAFTACTDGRPSEDNGMGMARPMLRKKTTLEMAERRRQLREEQREEEEEEYQEDRDEGQGEVGFALPPKTTLRSARQEEGEKDDDADNDDARGKKGEEKNGKDDNNSSVVARIESAKSSSLYGAEISYTGEEIVSKEKREDDEDEGEEGEEGNEVEKKELQSEKILRMLREDGVLDSIESSTAKYWKELAAKRKKTKKAIGKR
jgi:hypothetical protein